jgi:Cu/Zn superoxide dismutase
MRMTSLYAGIAGLAITSLVAMGIPASAQTVSYTAELSGKNEVPPNDKPGTGKVEITYNPATKELSWKGTMSGLSSAPSASHFHGPGEAGKNAGIQVPIPNPGNTFEGKATLTDAQASDLAGARLYVNVHTPAHPAGELRGQVVK